MNFGMVVFNKVEELDFIGPWEMLGVWSAYCKGPENRFIIAEKREPIACAKGLSINPHVSFADCPPLDFLLVPGGAGTNNEVSNPAMIAFVAAQAKNCKAVLSVCSGSFVLHAAGLLAHKKATTHWGMLQKLRNLGDVEVVEQRFINDGNIWSSAGISAGTDMMLAFIADFAGEDVAGGVQSGAEYYPDNRRYGKFHSGDSAPTYIRRQ